jgi:pimeloyl-ACP methyl ester carboxylesterase
MSDPARPLGWFPADRDAVTLRPVTNFVLVHGAWHGGWCWQQVVAALRAAGHVALAPDLPAHGEDSTPASEVDLRSYRDRVCEVIDSVPGEVVLVGHSLGGLTISLVAEQRADRLKSLVYLASFIPALASRVGEITEELTSPEIREAMRLSADGATLDIDVSKVREIFYADCSDEDVAWATERLCREPANVMRDAIELSPENFGRVPRDYIVCGRDKALLPEGQRAVHERSGCRKVYTMDTSHSPFFSAPEELAKLLGEIADL